MIYDEFIGTGHHEFEVNYQFAPGAWETLSDDCAVFDGNIDIAWSGRAPWTAQMKRGGLHPQDGWIAPSLGIRQAAPKLTLTCTTDEPHTSLLTVLAARVSMNAACGPPGSSGRVAAVW